MKALILAGGMGTRLHPVTLEIPKPLITIRRVPILNHLIMLFRKNGINDVAVLINKNHRADYYWWRKRYQKQIPKNLKLHIEAKPMGTFGGVRMLKKHFKEPFIMSNGDELKDFNLREMIKFHKSNPAEPVATIALVKVPNPSHYGVPIMVGASIKEFLEKPENPPTKYISSGLYVLDPKVFDYAPRDQEFLMIEKDIFPRLAADKKLLGYKIKNGRWFDCGTFERWEEAIKNW